MSNSEKLLTAEERDACQKIAAAGDELAGQRATALLAIDEGSTRAQASEQTGLTVGQVGYLLRVFRKKHLSMFPDAKPIKEEEEEEQPPEEPIEDEAETSEPKEAKTKKSKKGKKVKAKKKAKKPKKGKKAKAKKVKGKTAKKKSKKK